MSASRPVRALGITAFLLALLVHGAMLESLHSGRLNRWFNDSIHRKGQAVDYFTVYWGSEEGLAGRSLYQYDLPEGRTPSEPPYAYSNYRYFPGFAFSVGRLLTLLPPWASYWTWVCLLEALCLLGAAWAARAALRWGGGEAAAWFAAALWLGFTPYYLELYMGQFTLPLALILLGLLELAHARRLGDLGRAWVLSLLWKFATALYVPVFHRLRMVRTLLAAALAVALFTVPYFVFHPGDVLHFARYFVMGLGAKPHAGNHGLQTFLSVLAQAAWPGAPVLGTGTASLPVWRPLLLGLTLAGVALLWRRTLRGREEVGVMLCLWTSVYFALSRDVWEHHALMLLPVLVYLWARLPERRLGLTLAAALLALPTPLHWLDAAFTPAGLAAEADPEPYWPTLCRLLYHADKAMPALWLLWVSYRELEPAGRAEGST